MNSEKWETEKSKWKIGGQIRQFYAGKRILLTGCTGFLGTAIVEKLLRTCLEIDKIYVMIRVKRNMTIEERMVHFFRNPVFDTLHKTNSNFMAKVHPIYGDLQNVNLGLSSEDYQFLSENVDIIIHNAADVSFTSRISSILKTNVIGTKYMLDLADKCSRLKAFVYVSTAYSHCYNKRIEEKFYFTPGDLNMVEDLIRTDELTPDGIAHLERDILGKWPNTYTFSKSIAENLVADFAQKTSVACAVYRPSIVIASYKEPVPGWVPNQNGPASVLVTFGMGLLHVVPVKENVPLDVIPVDLSVNCLLAAIWNLTTHKKSQGPQVYNYGSSIWKPTHILTCRRTQFSELKKHPYEKMFWYPFLIMTESLYIFILLMILLHLLPAALADSILMLLGKKRRALDLAWKFIKFAGPLYYFATTKWIVEVKNSQDILHHMNTADHEEFPFDLGRMEWDRCIKQYSTGIKVNVLKESLDRDPAVKKKFQKLKIAHYSFCMLLLLLVTYVSYGVICSVCC